MITPPRIMLLATLLFVCGAVCLLIADKGPKTAVAISAALVAGVTALATHLSERQRRKFVLPAEQLETTRALVQQGRTSRAVRHLKDTAETDTGNAYRYVRRLEKSARFRSSYTSHSRA